MVQTSNRIDIVPFEPRFAADFERLNVEWLERYFEVEPIDAKVLSDPQAHIIAPGGAILMARQDGIVVGTCALKMFAARQVELTKMAVTASAQGAGVGRDLLNAAIDTYRGMAAELLFLESHSSLLPALHLYESVGFAHRPRPFASDYARADVYMEWCDPLHSDASGGRAT